MPKLLLLLAVVFLLTPQLAQAIRPASPLYWTPYEINYVTDDFIKEELFQQQVDWFAKVFGPLGYEGIVTDGWIYGDAPVNEYGYITHYNSAWLHDFRFWAEYCKSKKLSFGVYYNPLWIQESAFQKNPLIEGTSVHLQRIAGPARAPGARFNKHWVNPNEAGAKEYVQGYVRYFASLGVNLLRIDFLSEFEDTFGPEAYARALGWIREAAGDKLILSLVMPNNHDLARVEAPIGDMIRVSADTFQGGWPALSGRDHGRVFAKWPSLRNAFDGFIYYSEISGRGRVRLDGDAIRLNTFSNDEEKQTCLTLYTVAGSPIPVADQSTDLGRNLRFYANSELISLSREGFVGHPLSTDLKNPESQIWVGQTKNGDWVVGFFNREETDQTRELALTRLGLHSIMRTRNLWNNQEAESNGSLRVRLAPHASAIFRLRPL